MFEVFEAFKAFEALHTPPECEAYAGVCCILSLLELREPIWLERKDISHLQPKGISVSKTALKGTVIWDNPRNFGVFLPRPEVKIEHQPNRSQKLPARC